MNRILLALLALAIFLVPACNEEKKDVKIETENQKISYALGVDIGASLGQSPADLDFELVARGMIDSTSGGQLAMTTEEMQQSLSKLQEQMQAMQQEAMKAQMEEMKAQMEKSMAEGKAYLEENAKKEGVKTTDSGLQYEIIEKGDGPQPTDEDIVEVHYSGQLVNGTVFDSSYDRNTPATFPVQGVIPGFGEGIRLMHKGGKAKLVIPSDLAYGDRPAGPNIPAGSTLVFDVELLDVKSPSK